MQIEVRVRGIESKRELTEQARRRLEIALGRYGEDVSRVEVSLADVNGPKGGEDKRCLIRVRGSRFGEVVIQEEHYDVHAALDVAAGRADWAVARALERARANVRKVEVA